MKTVRVGRFQFQKKTKEEWLNSKVTLYDGELAIEADTSKIKIGDGRSEYRNLPYITIGNIKFEDLTEEEIKKITPDPITLNDMTKEEVENLVSQVGDYTKDQLLQISEIPIMAIEEPLIALSHLSDPGKDLVDMEGKLYRGDAEVGVRVKNGGTTYTIPDTVQKARIFFKAQCEEPTFDNYLFWWVGDGQDESKRYVSELENRTRHYSVVVDLSESHEIVISTVQAWDKTVKIWDFDWKEVL